MEAAIVVSPEGNSLVVTHVAVDLEGEINVWSAVRGAPPRRSTRPYGSLSDVVGENSRSTTTAYLVEVDGPDEAKMLLGREPPTQQ